MPAFFANRNGGRVVIEGGDARHLVRSLRARVGEHIDVIDPAGFLLDVQLTAISPDRVEGSVVAERAHDPEPRAHITIAIANLPAPSLELVLSRCTEAGAFGFKVFQAERSAARGSRPARWQAICREASMLATRLRVPEVESVASLQAVLDSAVHTVMLDRLAAVRLANLTSPVDLTLVIGPEGGWTERELDLVRIHASLGPRNLRADTAALAGLTVALAARE